MRHTTNAGKTRDEGFLKMVVTIVIKGRLAQEMVLKTASEAL